MRFFRHVYWNGKWGAGLGEGEKHPIRVYLSFPRRRESIWLMNINMDSRFRENDIRAFQHFR